jgi:hypothetical protein
MSSDVVMEVMSQADPTDWIKPPKFDTRLASHTARKVSCPSGASDDVRGNDRSSMGG